MSEDKRKPCPESVIRAGAFEVMAREMAEELVGLIIRGMEAIRATRSDVQGAKKMEYGFALQCLHEACKAEGLIGMSHDDLRKKLGKYGYAEPTDEQIMEEIERIKSEPRPRSHTGGGGGPGGR